MNNSCWEPMQSVWPFHLGANQPHLNPYTYIHALWHSWVNECVISFTVLHQSPWMDMHLSLSLHPLTPSCLNWSHHYVWNSKLAEWTTQLLQWWGYVWVWASEVRLTIVHHSILSMVVDFVRTISFLALFDCHLSKTLCLHPDETVEQKECHVVANC